MEDLATRCGDVTEKKKSEVQIMAGCYASNTVKLLTAQRIFSKM